MTYNKPEVKNLGSAVASIQSFVKHATIPTDGQQPASKTLNSAYESDE